MAGRIILIKASLNTEKTAENFCSFFSALCTKYLSHNVLSSFITLLLFSATKKNSNNNSKKNYNAI